MSVPDLEAEFAPPPDDPLRRAGPSADDVEARRARASIESKLFRSVSEPVKVGRYRIERRIAAGGMGVVYRAHDPELARDVAVKLINPDADSNSDAGAAQARLIREGRAMARLAHPNVIHVYDVGTVEGGVFVAMEFVEGSNLAAWLTDAVRPWQDILHKCIDAGRGLSAAHRAGVVHRDFKPENVLVGEDGRVRVVDFGLAGGPAAAELGHTLPSGERHDASIDGAVVHVALTKTGAVLGTPKYLAPEQYDSIRASTASDQFSFCVATYEALYGRPPFDGAKFSEYRRNVRAGVVVIPAQTSVPRRVLSVLLRGLAREPEERYPDMDALLDELERVLAPPASRRRAMIATLGAGMLATIATAFVMLRETPEPRVQTVADQAVMPAKPTTTATPAEPPASSAARDTPTEPRVPVAVPATANASVATQTSKIPPPSAPRASARGACYFHEDLRNLITRARPGTKQLRHDDQCYVCRLETREEATKNLTPRDCASYHLCGPTGASRCDDDE